MADCCHDRAVAGATLPGSYGHAGGGGPPKSGFVQRSSLENKFETLWESVRARIIVINVLTWSIFLQLNPFFMKRRRLCQVISQVAQEAKGPTWHIRTRKSAPLSKPGSFLFHIICAYNARRHPTEKGNRRFHALFPFSEQYKGFDEKCRLRVERA